MIWNKIEIKKARKAPLIPILKKGIKNMMREAVETWNDFHDLIRKSHKKFDKVIKEKLQLLEKVRIG